MFDYLVQLIMIFMSLIKLLESVVYTVQHLFLYLKLFKTTTKKTKIAKKIQQNCNQVLTRLSFGLSSGRTRKFSNLSLESDSCYSRIASSASHSGTSTSLGSGDATSTTGPNIRSFFDAVSSSSTSPYTVQLTLRNNDTQIASCSFFDSIVSSSGSFPTRGRWGLPVAATGCDRLGAVFPSTLTGESGFTSMRQPWTNPSAQWKQPRLRHCLNLNSVVVFDIFVG